MTAASLTRLCLLGAIWGASFALMRIAVAEFTPTTLIVIRLACAAAFLTVVVIVTARKVALLAKARHFLALGFINSAVPFFLFAFAAKTLPAASLAVFNSLAPVFGALIGRLWFGAPLSARTSVGLAIGVMGVATICGESLWLARHTEMGLSLPMALLAGVAAPACYGLSANYIKSRADIATPFENALGSMWAATFLTAPLLLLAPPTTAPSVEAWIAVLILGIVCTGAAYVLSFRIIADLGSTRALTVTFLIPLFGGLWGVLLLREPISAGLVAGGMLVIMGTALTMMSQKSAT